MDTVAYGAGFCQYAPCTVWHLMAQKTRLSRDRWIEAALDALADGGLAAVAVEPLAARLGVTEGKLLLALP